MSAPDLPELPDGWHYTDDVVGDDQRPRHRTRNLVLGVAIALAIAVALAVLVVWNADAHYKRGVAALDRHSYAEAASEFSAAKLLVLPYRDARSLAGQAQTELASEAAQQQQALARKDLLTGALRQAGTALERGDAGGVLAALAPLPPADMRAALREDSDVQAAAAALAARLSTAANGALRHLAWGRAARYAEALLVLQPSGDAAKALGARAQTGAQLSARLAKAQADARQGHWRSALRLALAVTAQDGHFPGATSLVAQARTALKPKPKPKSTPAATTSTATAPVTSSGGSSSGSSSQPPPP